MTATQTLLTVNEVAEMLAIKPKTLRNWVNSRKVEFERINGRTIRFTHEQVQAMRTTVKPETIQSRSKHTLHDLHGI